MGNSGVHRQASNGCPTIAITLIVLAFAGCGETISPDRDADAVAGGSGGSTAPAVTGGSGGSTTAPAVDGGGRAPLDGGMTPVPDGPAAAPIPPPSGPSMPIGDPMVACGAPVAMRDGTPRPAASGIPESCVVFDDAKLRTYTITIAPADLATLDRTALQEMYVPATLWIDNEEIGKVGVRYKGSLGTLQPCFDANTGKQNTGACPKVSYKISFDEYEPTKRFYGLKRLNLHSLLHDQTLLHERLAYKVFREMGVPAPRSVHGRVVVNGQYKGVYAVTEQIDGRFTADRFPGGGDGNLYKEAWPLSTTAADYDATLETNEEMKNHDKIVGFARAITAGTGPQALSTIAAWADLAYLMRYVAVDRAVSNWDGIMTFYCSTKDGTGPCKNHNFYWYQAEKADRFWLIPWDLDNTWRVWSPDNFIPAWNQPADCSQRPIDGWGRTLAPAPCDPFLAALGTVEASRYVAAVRQLLEGPFVTETLIGDVDRWVAQLTDAVKMDAFASKNWQNAIARFKSDIPLLRERLELIRDGKSPAPFGLTPLGPNDFEGTARFNVAAGVESSANPSSTITHTLNQTEPIAGGADLRVDFEFRNEGNSGFSQFSSIRVPFPTTTGVDLSDVREVRVSFKADGARSVRIDLDSRAYTKKDGGVRFGWETSIQPTGGVIALNPAMLAFPSWAPKPPPPDDVAVIKRSVSALVFLVSPRGRSAAGLLSASDKGFVQIDDVHFVK